MAGKSRRPKTSSEVARQTPRSVARLPPATSHAWTPPAYIHPASQRLVSVTVPVNNRRTSPRSVPARQFQPAKGVSFGSWSLPPTLTVKTVQAAHMCASRAIRREVLFATHSTGAGSKGRRLHFSNRRCK